MDCGWKCDDAVEVRFCLFFALLPSLHPRQGIHFTLCVLLCTMQAKCPCFIPYNWSINHKRLFERASLHHRVHEAGRTFHTTSHGNHYIHVGLLHAGLLKVLLPAVHVLPWLPTDVCWSWTSIDLMLLSNNTHGRSRRLNSGSQSFSLHRADGSVKPVPAALIPCTVFQQAKRFGSPPHGNPTFV